MKKNNKLYLFTIILLLITTIYLSLKYIPIFVIINGPSDITVEVHSNYEDEGAINRFTNKQITPISNLDIDTLGDYKIGYKSFIQTLYRTIHVVDTTAPEIYLNGHDVFLNINDDYIEEGVTIIDNYDNNLEDNLIINGEVDTSKIGQYKVDYTVSDNSNNVSETISRNIYVLEDDFNYLDKIDDTFNLDEEILNTITDYLNTYYRSIKYLKNYDISYLFSNDYLDNARLCNKAIDALVTYRNLSINDLKLDECSYSLEILEVEYLMNNIIKVTFLENADMKYHFLNGINTNQSKVWNYFYLTKIDDEYKLTEVLREEGVFLYFDRLFNENNSIETIYDDYMNIMKDSIDYYESQRKIVNDGEEYISLNPNHPYDRNNAKVYAIKYGNNRHPNYDSYESNCNNFVSQVMYEGGIPMDDMGEYQWKYFNPVHDEISEDYGFTYSWTFIPSFVEYLNNGDIVNNQDVNLYHGLSGDVLAVDMYDQDISLSPHVIVISDVVYDSKGNIIDLLICGNTNDQVNYPLSALTYAYKKLIKIEGYN